MLVVISKIATNMKMCLFSGIEKGDYQNVNSQKGAGDS